jgi:3-oxoacyl-[acyl-carrier protein] reductase
MSTTFDFTGRRVLVSGGTSGIGNGIATAFRDAGAAVALTGTRAGVVDYDIDLAGLDFHQLDVRDSGAVDAFAGSLGPLDVLVNNAGANLELETICCVQTRSEN